MFESGDISFKVLTTSYPPFQILKNLLKERDSFILFTLKYRKPAPIVKVTSLKKRLNNKQSSIFFCHIINESYSLPRQKISSATLGIQVRNMKMVFKSYCTWRRVTVEKLMMKI